jgi:cell division protein FtsB
MVARYGPARITDLEQTICGAFVKYNAWRKAHRLIKVLEAKVAVLELANASLKAEIEKLKGEQHGTKSPSIRPQRAVDGHLLRQPPDQGHAETSAAD